MQAKHCPHCQKVITLQLLREHGVHKAYLRREVFACPHCQQGVQLSPLSEKLTAIGILFSVVAAPLAYYWYQATYVSYGLFVFGLILIASGALNNQLQPATLESADETQKR